VARKGIRRTEAPPNGAIATAVTGGLSRAMRSSPAGNVTSRSHHQLKYAHAPFGRPDARRGIGDPQKALSTTVPLLPRTGTSKSIARFDTVSRVAARFCPADVPTYTASHARAAPVLKRAAASAAFDTGPPTFAKRRPRGVASSRRCRQLRPRVDEAVREFHLRGR